MKFSAPAMRRERIKHGWSVADLQRRLVLIGYEVTQEAVAKWDNGQIPNPGANGVAHLARVFRVKQERLFT